MIIRLDNLLCHVMLHKHMMWAWRFWWIKSVRVDSDRTTYVRIGFKFNRKGASNVKYI